MWPACVCVCLRGCDSCTEWFHGTCIGVSEKAAKAIRVWYCLSCRGQCFFHHAHQNQFHPINDIQYTHARTHVFSPCCVCISCARCVSSALAVILSSTDQDPSLEIKYRPKKNKEKKETEAEREEKSDDESSSPPPKIDRRRISQVRRAFSEIFVKYTPNTTISEIGLSPLGTSGDD